MFGHSSAIIPGTGMRMLPAALTDLGHSVQAEDARRRSRISDLHAQRQVLGVIGVVYCPMCASIPQAYEDFKKICRYGRAYLLSGQPQMLPVAMWQVHPVFQCSWPYLFGEP